MVIWQIVFACQFCEIEIELAGCGFHTEANIGHASSHEGGNGGVGELLLRRAVDAVFCQPGT